MKARQVHFQEWSAELQIGRLRSYEQPVPGCSAAFNLQSQTRISCHAALDEAACAPYSKERRMNFAEATKLHRKSGEGTT